MSLLGPLLATTVIAIAGWLAVHLLTAHRDRVNKRREKRLDNLVESYRTLATRLTRPDAYKFAAEIEGAIAIIQLFGSQAQIAALRDFTSDAAQRNRWSGDKLGNVLSLLRDDLRAEIGLPPSEGQMHWIRLTAPSDQAASANANSGEHTREG
jgi:hypothetical protein